VGQFPPLLVGEGEMVHIDSIPEILDLHPLTHLVLIK
jgi:hypothetical protein